MDQHELARRIRADRYEPAADELLAVSRALAQPEAAAARVQFEHGVQQRRVAARRLASWEEEMPRRKQRLVDALLAEVPEPAAEPPSQTPENADI